MWSLIKFVDLQKAFDITLISMILELVSDMKLRFQTHLVLLSISLFSPYRFREIVFKCILFYYLILWIYSSHPMEK